MTTLNLILKEVNAVPAGRLEELYQFVLSLMPEVKQTANVPSIRRNKILSFAGIFNDMDENEFFQFNNELKETRESAFSRTVNL